MKTKAKIYAILQSTACSWEMWPVLLLVSMSLSVPHVLRGQGRNVMLFGFVYLRRICKFKSDRSTVSSWFLWQKLVTYRIMTEVMSEWCDHPNSPYQIVVTFLPSTALGSGGLMSWWLSTYQQISLTPHTWFLTPEIENRSLRPQS